MNGIARADVAIAGGGIIGLSLGLELRHRGLSVLVIDRQQAMSSASWAAGGMLAVHDPQNPAELMPLATKSWELYPAYLERVEALSGKKVPLRTRRAMQFVAGDHWAENASRSGVGAQVTSAEMAEFAPALEPNGHIFEWLDEGSLDPNDLHDALPAAFVAAGGTLLEETEMLSVENVTGGVLVKTTRKMISAGMFVNCCGARAGEVERGLPVVPVKGQMANLRCKPERLRCVVRAPGIYLLPRGDGRVTIGATIEHVGFDETVQETSIRRMAEAALSLLPEAEAPVQMDMWAGLRPGTPDGLPILGPAAMANCWHATGHYRDGILLGPVTGRVMAQVMLGEAPEVPLAAYAATRFLSEENCCKVGALAGIGR
ncbi:MAG: FAD-dependent oxidoreductase [Acidobacteriota bacterium]|nr:FAD-dependent oxidoreductase [Acidobacteriota bacterium]